MLHITNGDAAVAVMAAAGITGEILPWRDVLHEGPVPGGLALEALSEIRAGFIAESGWGERAAVENDFRERDTRLAAFREHEEVVLWFEHDLYDQLQLLQLLDWFSRQDTGRTSLSLICTDEYLGPMQPERLAAFFPQRTVITAIQLLLGSDGWTAYCSSDPVAWERLLMKDTSALPFLSEAILRHLEQYPSLENGANRTERALLDAVQSGVERPGRLFAAVQDTEERRFMGDSTFWSYLGAMTESRPPLLRLRSGVTFSRPETHAYPAEFAAQEILITDTGRRVSAGEVDWLDIKAIDKWYGGVHLKPGSVWRWDSGRRTLVRSGV